MTEIAPINLEEELLDHLVIAESAMTIWREHLDPELVDTRIEGIKDTLVFVLGYIDKNREAPTPAVISAETGFCEFHEPTVPVEFIIEKLRARGFRKVLNDVALQMARGVGDPIPALQEAYRELSSAIVQTTSQKHIFDASDFSSVMDRYRNQVEYDPISFGYDEMDESLGGGMTPGLYFMLGRLKRYKSWQQLKSIHATLKQDKAAIFATLEMSGAEMQDRLACMWSGISWTKFNHKSLTHIEVKKLSEAADEIRETAKIKIIRPPFGERSVPHLLNYADYHPCDAYYIDQLGYVEATRRSDQQYQEITSICQQLKDGSDRFPICVTHQLSREADKDETMAKASQIALSDGVGQIADTCLALNQTTDMRNNGILHYGVIESRSFEPGVWEIKVELSDRSNFRLLNRVE